MNTNEYSFEIVKELGKTLSNILPGQAEELIDKILGSKKIFVAGAGRSGFMVKAFAMRMMHLGFDAYVTGETITPNIEMEDILIIGSGSGETGSLVSMANKAKKIGSKIALVTIFPQSSIGLISDVVIKIPAPTPKVDINTGFKSIQPMGSLFEQSLLLFLDSIVLRLMGRMDNNSATMFTKHANLE